MLITALAIAVPQFSGLRFDQDEVNGIPHLCSNFNHCGAAMAA
ncbi:hypothetical protein [Xylophilus sp.]|nr:hypothetical protein [Xylophilus sp.]